MNDKPLVSAGILCYNQAQYIRQTVDCVLAQRTRYPFEIVIGDDGSTDGSREILEDYERRFPGKVRLLPRAPNKGVLMNYADTVSYCRGKYIAFCSGDDYWHNPNKLELEVDFLEKNPDYGLVHGDADYFYEKENILLKNRNTKEQGLIKDGHVFNELLRGDFEISALTVCCRKVLVDQYVNFQALKKEGFTYEDYPTWLSLALHTKFKYFPDSFATYRIVPNTISRPNEIGKKLAFVQEKARIRRYFSLQAGLSNDFQSVIEVRMHQEIFELGYVFREQQLVRKAFQYLHSRGKVGWKIRLKKTLVEWPFLYRLFCSVGRYLKGKKRRLKSW